MKILKTGAETDGQLLSIECYSPASKIREPEHVHPHQIPACAPHHFWNESEKEAHCIQKFKPALDIESFFRTYFMLAAEYKLNKKGKPNLLWISKLCLKH